MKALPKHFLYFYKRLGLDGVSTAQAAALVMDESHKNEEHSFERSHHSTKIPKIKILFSL